MKIEFFNIDGHYYRSRSVIFGSCFVYNRNGFNLARNLKSSPFCRIDGDVNKYNRCDTCFLTKMNSKDYKSPLKFKTIEIDGSKILILVED